MENIFKDLEKLKSNYNELVKQKPLTYILLEIAPKTYPFLSNFIDEATGIYNNMFGSTNTKPPYLYFCNHDFAKGWFQPNPKSIEEKLIKYGVNPDKSSIIEEVEHDPTGKPSVFISPHNKSFETDLWVIIHELAHWADYTFLNLEEFLGEKKESEELIQEFMKLFRIELPGEIFSKQCTNRILDKIPDIGRAIKSYTLSELKTNWQKADERIQKEFGYSSLSLVHDKSNLQDFIQKSEDYIPRTGELEQFLKSIPFDNQRDIQEEYKKIFERIIESKDSDYFANFPIYSKRKLISKVTDIIQKEDFFVDRSNEKKEKELVIKKLNDGLDKIKRSYCKNNFGIVISIIEFLLPYDFALQESKITQMKQRFSKQDCYNLVQEIYKSN